jgi:hypothetical protein
MSEKFRKDFHGEILEGEKILKILNTKTSNKYNYMQL